MGPVVASAGEYGHRLVGHVDLDAVAVELDFVNPSGSGRHLLDRGRQASRVAPIRVDPTHPTTHPRFRSRRLTGIGGGTPLPTHPTLIAPSSSSKHESLGERVERKCLHGGPHGAGWLRQNVPRQSAPWCVRAGAYYIDHDQPFAAHFRPKCLDGCGFAQPDHHPRWSGFAFQRVRALRTFIATFCRPWKRVGASTGERSCYSAWGSVVTSVESSFDNRHWHICLVQRVNLG